MFCASALRMCQLNTDDHDDVAKNFFRNIQITPKDKTDYIRDSVQAGISGLMNLASQGGDPNSNLLFVNFNQDCT